MLVHRSEPLKLMVNFTIVPSGLLCEERMQSFSFCATQTNAGICLEITDNRQKGEEMLKHQLFSIPSERGISVFRLQHFEVQF